MKCLSRGGNLREQKRNKGLYERFFKRAIDFVVSLLAIIILSPVFLVIIIAIKFDSKGPVFFCQKRVGIKQSVFNIIKFRTMVVNAEYIGDGLRIKSECDPRITKVGGFLRRTSLDELPQFINVLKGDMAMIGPRPPVTYHPYKVGEYDDVKKHRFDVKPGISGLAQARIRNSGTWDERIVIDLEYVDNVSLKNDLKIIIDTIKIIMKRDSVY